MHRCVPGTVQSCKPRGAQRPAVADAGVRTSRRSADGPGSARPRAPCPEWCGFRCDPKGTHDTMRSEKRRGRRPVCSRVERSRALSDRDDMSPSLTWADPTRTERTRIAPWVDMRNRSARATSMAGGAGRCSSGPLVLLAAGAARARGAGARRASASTASSLRRTRPSSGVSARPTRTRSAISIAALGLAAAGSPGEARPTTRGRALQRCPEPLRHFEWGLLDLSRAAEAPAAPPTSRPRRRVNDLPRSAPTESCRRPPATTAGCSSTTCRAAAD